MRSPSAPVRDDRPEPSISTSGDGEKRLGLWIFVGSFLLFGVIVSVLVAIAPFTRTMQVKSTMKSLGKAITTYQRVYRELPHAGGAAPLADTGIDSADATGCDFFETFTGPSPRNMRGMTFWYPPTTGFTGYLPGSGLHDAWARSYRIILDYDGDHRITDPEGVAGGIAAECVIYSAGPDGDFSTWKDNVCSWK